MLSALRKHWLLLLALPFFLLAALVILCWQVYATKRIVVYPLVNLYDYTDAGTNIGNSSNAIGAFLFLFGPGVCLLFFWLRGRNVARRIQALLLACAIFFLVVAIPWAAWLSYSSVSLKKAGLSGTEQENGHMYYWHQLSLSSSSDNSEPYTVRERFQCDDRQLLCSFSSREPYGP